MKIALWEPFPLTETLLRSHLKKIGAEHLVSVEKAEFGKHYDLVLFEASFFPEDPFCSSDLWLVPASCTVKKLPQGAFLTGGMGIDDDVSLSSIREKNALMCIQREVVIKHQSLIPQERIIPFDRNFTLYKNLAAGFALLWAKNFFGEEL
ncbi:MAG: hypothetical protein IKT50_00955 [Clostridia bacterium]|nr:hypothetical protein [Clostridia bacterium]